jgi:FMN phosphatase YigB (HAD superfamily)
MPLRAVLFDLWETLIHDMPERAQPRREWRCRNVIEVLARREFLIEPEHAQAALDAASARLVALHDTGRDLDSLGRAMLFIDELHQRTGRRAPDSVLGELEAVTLSSMPLEIAPVAAPFAAETLAGIKGMGLATALVCNAGFTTKPHLLPMLEHYDLSPYLDVMLFSDALQIAKPHPRIFEAALNALGVEARECVFVGDNPHTDIAGAQSVGIFAIQIGNKQRDGVTPNARIESLDELIPLLGRDLLVTPD